MRRAVRVLVRVAAIVLGLPVALIVLVLLLANLPPGQRLIEALTARLTGGTVLLHGLSGRVPDRLRLAHLELRDGQGAWLTADGLALDWSPAQLLHGEASVQRLAADAVALPRLPAAAPADATASGSFRLPLPVSVARLRIGRLALGAPVAGVAAVLAVNGQAALTSLEQGEADLTLRRLDGAGAYHLAGRLDPAAVHATLTAQEPAQGLLSGLAGLPDLGAVTLAAALDGPRTAAAASIALAAGPLRAAAQGRLDLPALAADLSVTASAPAMAPRDDLSWQAVALRAHVQGPLIAPDADGTLRIDALHAAGASLASVTAELAGNTGDVHLRATLAGVHLPGPSPDLLAAAPVAVTAELRLDQPSRPVRFALSHPLLALSGQADTAPALHGTADLTLPDLAPLAAMASTDLQGHARLALQAGVQDGTTSVTVNGTLGITGGMAPVPALIGEAATVSLAGSLRGSDIVLDHATLAGAGVSLSAQGTDTGGALDLSADAALADVSEVAATLEGAVRLHGHAAGSATDLSVQADLSGEIGAPGVQRGPITLALRATGLPSHPSGRVTGQGTLLGAPLRLDADVVRDAGGAMHATITQADWQSLHASGAVSLAAGAAVPVGTLDLRMASLADLRPLLGQAVRGSLTATAELTEAAASLQLEARQVALDANGAALVRLAATVAHPAADPVLDATLQAEGISAAGVTGRASLSARGPQTALALALSADAAMAGAPASATAAALLNLPARTLRLSALQAAWHGTALRLLAPAGVAFGEGVAVDRLSLGAGSATLEAGGKLAPALDLTVALRGVTPELARAFAAVPAADGLLEADARLTGTLARPAGRVQLRATGLHLRDGPGRALPPASLTASATLQGTSAEIEAALAAGPRTRLTLAGQAPLRAGAALALRANGLLDLALLDPILTAQGRRVQGRVTLDAAVAGTLAAPLMSGSLQLAGGDVQDFAQGVHLSAITAAATFAGDSLRIATGTARAGAGSIELSGSIGLLAPGLPVDLTLTMRRAQPLASDRLTATLSADLTLRGQAATRLDATGTVTIATAAFRVPETLPASVAVLDVQRAGQPPPPAPAGPAIGLDVTVAAERGIFVRGRGLDAELGGRLHLGGTAAAPVAGGGFQMRRGSFSVAGTVLDFSKGEISFDGASITDPSLDFLASTTNNNVTANLAITGTASAPKITLSASPPLPQDEVLSYLLFRRSTAQLSPFQLVAIAQTLASFTGAGSSIADPLESVRTRLGLDRLAVTGGSTGSTPTVEAGRYIADGIYVGAKQGTAGADTQGQVQIDIARGLKLETDVGSGKGGNSVGLTYQFEY